MNWAREKANSLVSGWQGLWLIKTSRATENLAFRVEQALIEAKCEGAELAARIADGLFNGFHSPHEYSRDVAEAIREASAKLKGERAAFKNWEKVSRKATA